MPTDTTITEEKEPKKIEDITEDTEKELLKASKKEEDKPPLKTEEIKEDETFSDDEENPTNDNIFYIVFAVLGVAVLGAILWLFNVQSDDIEVEEVPPTQDNLKGF